MIVGLAAIGKVYVEALIISYGEGRNGKSTFWNVISRVLGNYSGSISADILTSQIRRNVKPELAEAKRRLIVIPFLATIDGSKDVKNYADYLFETAGGSILQWILDGARKVIEVDYHLPIPEKVRGSIEAYQQANDWLGHFVDECCKTGKELIEKSGEVYSEYRSFCQRTGEYTRSSADFYAAIENAGFERFKDRKGRYIKGLRIKSEFLE